MPVVATLGGSGQQLGLDDVQQGGDPVLDLADGDGALLAGVAAHERDLALGQVAGAHLDAHRYALELPVGGPSAEAGGRLGVEAHPDAGGLELRHQRTQRPHRAPSSSRTSSTTAWMGASAGGTTRPWSSPWAMISPPTMRVEVPHDVVQQSCWSPLASR